MCNPGGAIERSGAEPRCSCVDLAIASYVLDPDLPLGLRGLVKRSLHEDMGDLEGEGHDEVNDSLVLNAAYALLRTAAVVQQRLEASGLNAVAQLDYDLLPVLANMETLGVQIDKNALRELGNETSKKLSEIKEQVVAIPGVEPFNLASPMQLGKMMKELGARVPVRKSTQSLMTSEKVLKDIISAEATPEPARELAGLALEHRSLSKLFNTYILGLENSVDSRSGRIHATIHQTTAATGRLSMSQPNLQALPAKNDFGRHLRKAIVPKDGYVLLSADYEQIELRIIAAMSGDEAMRDAFKRGDDFHSAAAMALFGVKEMSDVTKEQRSRAKEVNYGIPYGISAYGLASRLRIGNREAQELIDQYYATFPQVKGFLDSLVTDAKENLETRTLMGRRRYTRKINSPIALERAAAERVAVNTPIQGTQADMIKLAMISVTKRLADEKLATRLVLQIHDELLFEVLPEEIDETAAVIKECMCRSMSLPGGVAVELSMGLGNSWYDIDP